MHALYTPRRRKVRTSGSDAVFYTVVNILMALILLVVLYPLVYVVSSSFSSAKAIQAGRVVLWPVELSLDGYRTVFQYRTVTMGYRNSLLYMTSGTAINVCMTLLCAYPLARKTLPLRGFFMFLFTFTMYFGGGLIPSYLLMRTLGIINTIWALVLPGAISVYNMIITRTFMQTNIPDEMLEATQIDGASDSLFFFQMVLPLSKAIIAVITLYYAVGHWNSWFSAFIYLTDRAQYPLQLILRDILIVNQLDAAMLEDPELASRLMGLAELMKYALIVIASVPMMALYPFVQKYFIQGVMIGSLKG